MKPSSGWILGGIAVWAAVMAVVVSAQQPAPAPAAQGEKSPQEILFERLQRGERVMNLTCSSAGCHTIRPVQTAAKDEAGWTKTIDDMIAKGAKVPPEDRPFLIDYLVRFHGPLPEGDGKEIVLNICTMCHDLERVRTHGGSVEDWFDLLNAMIGEGAPLLDDQIPIVLKYLATNFPPRS